MHPLFSLVGMTIFTLMADSLHIMEIGTLHRIIGNVLFHVCFIEGLVDGTSPKARLDNLWAKVVAVYGRQDGLAVDM